MNLGFRGSESANVKGASGGPLYLGGEKPLNYLRHPSHDKYRCLGRNHLELRGLADNSGTFEYAHHDRSCRANHVHISIAIAVSIVLIVVVVIVAVDAYDP